MAESKVQVVGIGLATLDVLVRLTDMPTWESGARLKGLRFDGGGLVGTALVAAARLGARTGYIGHAGDDDAGRLKVQTLTREGVDVSRLRVFPEPERQVVLVMVHHETGERTFALVEGMRSTPLTAADLDRSYIVAAEFLHVDGYYGEAALAAARWMHEAGKRVVMDGSKTCGPISADVQDLIREVDVLICGSGFAQALTGEAGIWEAGCAALAFGPSIVVQTEGEEGSYTVTRDETFHTPAFGVDVVDTTGAGDVFHGAYMVGLLKGWDLRRVALFSSAVSAMKCTHEGGRAGIPSFPQVLAFLRERGITIE
ncbi:MAG: carbohydrate kinase family protein [Anaerolineae bacterium]